MLIRFMTAELLRSAGYTVLEAGNAPEALSILRSSTVDLVLTDIRMPGSPDGVQLASLVRKLWPQIKIVILSAYSPQWPVSIVLDGFIGKPYDRLRLLARISEVLKRDR